MANAMTIEETVAELANLESAFRDVQSRRDAAFGTHWNNKYDSDSLKEASHAARNPDDTSLLEAMHQRLDAVCTFYLQTDNNTRERMREEVSGRKSLLDALHKHVAWCSERLASGTELEYLRTGLAAIALHDNRIDFRDSYVALATLYIAASKAGTHPSLLLYKVGALASDISRTKWAEDSTRNFLQRFEESEYYKGYVRPKLNSK